LPVEGGKRRHLFYYTVSAVITEEFSPLGLKTQNLENLCSAQIRPVTLLHLSSYRMPFESGSVYSSVLFIGKSAKEHLRGEGRDSSPISKLYRL
jgi:hypothetical protein